MTKLSRRAGRLAESVTLALDARAKALIAKIASSAPAEVGGRLAEGLGGRADLGHVPHGAVHPQWLAGLGGDQLGPAVQAPHAPVGPDDPVLDVHRPAVVKRPLRRGRSTSTVG